MVAYYNEIDPYAAQWLRNLIAAGHIAPGVVDERSIEDVLPSDLDGFTQCHFFAGIGVWSLALRRAGWADDRPVWTGSCPCQPFSAAGKGVGFADERHLWPAFFHLITQCRPAVVLGEQVASKDADPWIDLVCADMEAMGYAFGAVPFPSAGVGAPHIRDRLYWVAHADGMRQPRVGGRGENGIAQRGEADGLADTGRTRLERRQRAGQRADAQCAPVERGSPIGGLGHSERLGAWRDAGTGTGAQGGAEVRAVGDDAGSSGAVGGVADADGGHASAERLQRGGEHGQQPQDGGALQHTGPGPTNGLWRDADWLACRDGRWRPVEPGTFPLAHGAPARVGRLRAYGNAINAEAAKIFIECVMDS